MNGCETLENLWCNWDKCKKLIPPTRGIYRIVAPIEMTISFSPEINGHPIADAYDVSVLENKYEKANHPPLTIHRESRRRERAASAHTAVPLIRIC